MKSFVRFLVRILLSFLPVFCAWLLLYATGLGGALPTLVFVGAGMSLSWFLLKKYNYRCAEKDSREIKSFTEINKGQGG